MSEYIGHIAALATALCWSFTAIFFSEAGRRIGSFRVNKIRLLYAVLIYCIVLFLTTGRIWPEGINAQQVIWLAGSGIIGLVIGDGLGFKALVMIGPRITTLLWSTAPIMATVIAWFLLGEQLHILDLLGIALTVGGIAWVVSERQFKQGPQVELASDHPDAGSKIKGVFLGLGAAFGQAAGLVMSKHAMLDLGEPVEPMPASFIRMLASMVVIWLLGAFRGELTHTIKAFRHGSAQLFTTGGALVGPFLGVWMSLLAVKYIEAGIAATLNATTPILIIPVVIMYYKEKVSSRALLGAIIAFLGVALLFVGDELSRLL
ncbi:EamA family transporter [candidate division GN15 bacterium]|nr:EamA family transporter [candidate division GN15 bacterium]